MSETQRRGRGRPKGTGKVDPEDIIGAALDALADGGYRALTMRGIARTLNISLSSVQNHFSTKDDLWRAAVDQLRTDTIERRHHAEFLNLAPAIMALLEDQTKRPGLLASLLTDNGEGSTERTAYVAETFRALLARPVQELEELEESGRTRHFNPDAFLALMTIGIGSIAAASNVLEAIYGFDVSSEQGRTDLAKDFADILSLGIHAR